MSDIVDRARRNAKVIYIAVAESVADEISGVFVDCADEIDRLRAALATTQAERDIAQESARALAVSVVRATTERDAAITERDAAQRRAQVAVDWVREIGDEIARLKAERDWRTVDTVRVSLAAVLAQEEK